MKNLKEISLTDKDVERLKNAIKETKYSFIMQTDENISVIGSKMSIIYSIYSLLGYLIKKDILEKDDFEALFDMLNIEHFDKSCDMKVIEKASKIVEGFKNFMEGIDEN